jgi:hypothetical protein
MPKSGLLRTHKTPDLVSEKDDDYIYDINVSTWNLKPKSYLGKDR